MVVAQLRPSIVMATPQWPRSSEHLDGVSEELRGAADLLHAFEEITGADVVPLTPGWDMGGLDLSMRVAVTAFALRRVRQLLVPFARHWVRRRQRKIISRELATAQMPAADPQWLSVSPLLSQLPEQCLQHIANAMSPQVALPPESIVYEGSSAAAGLMLVAEGSVDVLRGLNRRQAGLVGTFQAPCVFGDAASLCDGAHHHSIVAATPCVVFRCSPAAVRAALDLPAVPRPIAAATIDAAFDCRKHTLPLLDPLTPACLASSPLFAPLSETELRTLTLRFAPRVYRKGQALCSPGDRADELFYLAAGRIAVVAPFRGALVLAGHLAPRCCFAELAAAFGDAYGCSYVADQHSSVWALPARDLRAALAANPLALAAARDTRRLWLAGDSATYRKLAARTPIFSSVLTPAEMAEFTDLWRARVYWPGNSIVSRADQCDRVMLLLSGRAGLAGRPGVVMPLGCPFGFTLLVRQRWGHTLIAQDTVDAFEAPLGVVRRWVRGLPPERQCQLQELARLVIIGAATQEVADAIDDLNAPQMYPNVELTPQELAAAVRNIPRQAAAAVAAAGSEQQRRKRQCQLRNTKRPAPGSGEGARRAAAGQRAGGAALGGDLDAVLRAGPAPGSPELSESREAHAPGERRVTPPPATGERGFTPPPAIGLRANSAWGRQPSTFVPMRTLSTAVASLLPRSPTSDPDLFGADHATGSHRSEAESEADMPTKLERLIKRGRRVVQRLRTLAPLDELLMKKKHPCGVSRFLGKWIAPRPEPGHVVQMGVFHHVALNVAAAMRSCSAKPHPGLFDSTRIVSRCFVERKIFTFHANQCRDRRQRPRCWDHDARRPTVRRRKSTRRRSTAGTAPASAPAESAAVSPPGRSSVRSELTVAQRGSPLAEWANSTPNRPRAPLPSPAPSNVSLPGEPRSPPPPAARPRSPSLPPLPPPARQAAAPPSPPHQEPAAPQRAPVQPTRPQPASAEAAPPQQRHSAAEPASPALPPAHPAPPPARPDPPPAHPAGLRVAATSFFFSTVLAPGPPHDAARPAPRPAAPAACPAPDVDAALPSCLWPRAPPPPQAAAAVPTQRVAEEDLEHWLNSEADCPIGADAVDRPRCATRTSTGTSPSPTPGPQCATAETAVATATPSPPPGAPPPRRPRSAMARSQCAAEWREPPRAATSLGRAPPNPRGPPQRSPGLRHPRFLSYQQSTASSRSMTFRAHPPRRICTH
eukprot:TRINITY_DN21233_c0_g1_i1.p1 TRINITY_DN21233_c0_g1~~TRINITY_DN21233_c0_g1_i1.p1  ORF type:complete len:1217 (+),score=252.44 TRINITY_DN21233_c0_g1_i1:89-3739(+)